MHSPAEKRFPKSFVRKIHQISRCKSKANPVDSTCQVGLTTNKAIVTCDELLSLVSARAAEQEKEAKYTHGSSKKEEQSYEVGSLASMLGGVDGIETPQADFMDFPVDDGVTIEQAPFTKFKLRRMGSIKIKPSKPIVYTGKQSVSNDELKADMDAKPAGQSKRQEHQIDAQLSQGTFSNKVMVGSAALSLRRMRKSRSPTTDKLAEQA